MGVFSALHATVLEEARPHLPPSFSSWQRGLALFSKPYLYYRSLRFLSLAETKKGVAIQGAVLHLIADCTNIGSYALHIVLVAKCAEDLLHEYRKLGDCYQQLQKAICWQYPTYQAIRKKEISSLPPWLLLRQKELYSLMGQIRKIIRAIANLFWQGFQLSIRLHDTYLLFNGDSQTRYEGCVELIAEWSRYQEQLQNDYLRVIEEIQKRSDLIDRLLTRLGKEAKTAEILEKFKNVQIFSSDWLKDCKQAAAEALDSFYIDGKITPFHIGFSKELRMRSLPPLSFPAWAGQRIETPRHRSPIPPSPTHNPSSPLHKMTSCLQKISSPLPAPVLTPPITG